MRSLRPPTDAGRKRRAVCDALQERLGFGIDLRLGQGGIYRGAFKGDGSNYRRISRIQPRLFWDDHAA